MYQISKSKEGKVIEVYTSHNPQRQLSNELENTTETLRPNWSELSQTQGVYFDTADGFTYWIHQLP